MSSVIMARGFTDPRLVTHWGDIVGSEYRDVYIPSRVRIATYRTNRRMVLYLLPLLAAKCAFEFPYVRKILIDKICLYFGHSIIDDIRLINDKH